MANVHDLSINGVTMPTPALDGVTISTEKIWSADTGRTGSGKMVGTVIARKTTIKIKWPPMSYQQAALIEQAVSDGDFVPVSYTDMTGHTVTKTVYFSTPSYTLYSLAPGIQWVKDISVTGVEQ